MWGMEGFSLLEARGLGGHPSLHVWVMIAVGAMFSTITHPRGGLRKEKTLFPRMRANAAPDGARRYLSASGGDVEGQAPGVIYSK